MGVGAAQEVEEIKAMTVFDAWTAKLAGEMQRGRSPAFRFLIVKIPESYIQMIARKVQYFALP